MCSLEHFHETSGLDEEDSNEIWAIPPEKAMHLASVIYGLDSHRYWLCHADCFSATA
jgi:hypothetical protein